jgi:histidine phosphotransferase ChpT
MSKDLEFSELMCARFCHDLAGCVGAISNSIDFLDSKNDEMRNKAIDLVKFSSSQAISRVAFFRKAYGFASVSSELSLSEIKSLTNSFLGGEKLEIKFSNLEGSNTINANLGKLILNTALIVSTLVMHRGEMEIKIDKDFDNIEINASGGSNKISDDLLAILEGTSQLIEKNTRNIQYFYTYAVAKSINYAIDLRSDSEGVRLTLAPKS